MVDAATIFEAARGHGITLSVVGDRIRYSPKSKTPEKLLELIRAHKGELLTYLASPTPGAGAVVDSGLLAWAAELAEQDIELVAPIEFTEAPLRTVTTLRVSYYASHYLKTIAHVRVHRSSGGFGSWTPSWWDEQEMEALDALKALREAVDMHEGGLEEQEEDNL